MLLQRNTYVPYRTYGWGDCQNWHDMVAKATFMLPFVLASLCLFSHAFETSLDTIRSHSHPFLARARRVSFPPPYNRVGTNRLFIRASSSVANMSAKTNSNETGRVKGQAASERESGTLLLSSGLRSNGVARARLILASQSPRRAGKCKSSEEIL